jgi:hypothetical protein
MTMSFRQANTEPEFPTADAAAVTVGSGLLFLESHRLTCSTGARMLWFEDASQPPPALMLVRLAAGRL